MTGHEADPLSTTPDTSMARGTVRDALGGLRNLLGLIRSIRVGPQAVAAVIPDVHASCAPMSRALDRLLSDLPPETSVARQELSDFLLPEAATLERALGKVKSRTLRAKDRLALERALVRGVRNIEIGFRLLSILLAGRRATTVSVDVAELASGEGPLVSPAPLVTRTVALAIGGPCRAVAVDPGLAAAMLAVGAGLLDKKAPLLHLEVMAQSGECTLHLATGTGHSDRKLTVLEAARPTKTCLEALASLSGCRVTVRPGSVEFVVPSAG